MINEIMMDEKEILVKQYEKEVALLHYWGQTCFIDKHLTICYV